MKIINTWLIKGLYILSIAIILYGCSKGKLDEDFVPLSNIIFNSETMIYPQKIEVGGKIYNAFGTSTIVPYNAADSTTDAVAIFSDGKRLNFKFENKADNFLYSNILDPIDSIFVITKANPSHFDVPPEGLQYIKLVNQNTQLSPDGSPIYLVFFEYNTPFTMFVDEYFPPQLNKAVDTLFNVTGDKKSLPKLMPRTPTGTDYMAIIAKVLKSNKEELLIDGKRVYLSLPYFNEGGVAIIKADEQLATEDFNNPMYEPSPDGGWFLRATSVSNVLYK
ncbi:hypothetical protein [Sphingobacterium sp. UBA6645]|uniref:hypothetical protein n=1 Tax=Sphingobacterium sp. UBA6645 TaxID=1947511 RepID=UPI0025E2A616|nr:hypothetical protein [Sphingobacterium sp. UBA6645]